MLILHSALLHKVIQHLTMSIKITYAITVCNENEVEILINQLSNKVDFNSGEYELLIQFDSNNVTDSVLNLISKYPNELDHCRVIGFPLDGNFAIFKNNLIEYANGEYIFQIDADETLGATILNPDKLYSILQYNSNVDLFYIPRINIVVGITEDYIQTQGWKSKYNGFKCEDVLGEKSINFPDYQGRIFKRNTEIQWKGSVHEQISGARVISVFPSEEDFALEHIKTFERQITQNNLYLKLTN